MPGLSDAGAALGGGMGPTGAGPTGVDGLCHTAGLFDLGDERAVAISEVSDKTVYGMVDVLRGFFEQNDALVLQGIEAIGFVAEGGDRALLDQTVKTYFRKLLKLEARTPAALMKANAAELEALADPEVERSELRKLMRSVHYPDGWFYVERASIMMFWLAGQIAPDLDQVQVGFPYVLPLLSERLASTRPSSSPDGDTQPGASG